MKGEEECGCGPVAAAGLWLEGGGRRMLLEPKGEGEEREGGGEGGGSAGCRC